MTFRMEGKPESGAAAVGGGGVLVASGQDMLDIIGSVQYLHGCSRIIIKKENIAEAFFDLSSGLAGEVLQKVVNYHAALAIVGDFSGYQSKALRDFIRESNRGSRVFFVASEAEALERLEKAVL